MNVQEAINAGLSQETSFKFKTQRIAVEGYVSVRDFLLVASTDQGIA